LKELDSHSVERLEDYCKFKKYFIPISSRNGISNSNNTITIDRNSIFQKNGISKTIGKVYSDFISEQFRRLFLSYSKSINKQSGRKGSLFDKNFKRKEIDHQQYLINTIIYIHRNPQHHGFTDDFANFRWSSYNRIIEEKVTKLHKSEVLQWFDNQENYRYAHTQNIEDDIE
jgi:hypothetical protein